MTSASTRPFDGKVALVTGASAGLGAATALQFARDGASVVIAARREDQGEAVARAARDLGTDALFVRADVTRREDVEAMLKATLDRFGRLDCAVNNAGISGPVGVPAADVTEDQWDAVMNLNLRAVWLCMKHQIPAMLAHGAGAIVNVSSIFGYKPSDIGHAAYCASKHAVIGLSKTAAIDYGQAGLRINVIAPGFTLSEMVDPVKKGVERYARLATRYSAMNRLGNAEETANAITWLCSDAASFVNGAVLSADGGDAAKLY
jgi:NAD(P)-dependent dehydrogenase (short-subunit alcohol dehydrogenase family)